MKYKKNDEVIYYKPSIEIYNNKITKTYLNDKGEAYTIEEDIAEIINSQTTLQDTLNLILSNNSLEQESLNQDINQKYQETIKRINFLKKLTKEEQEKNNNNNNNNKEIKSNE